MTSKLLLAGLAMVALARPIPARAQPTVGVQNGLAASPRVREMLHQRSLPSDLGDRENAALASSTQEQCSVLAEFPFQLREGLIWVEVRVPQSRQPLHFLVDSGAQVSVLNLRTAKRLHLKFGEPVAVEGVETVREGFWPVHLTADIDGIKLPNQYLVVDLPRLNPACSRQVDGLVGADFFASHVVRVDFVARRIQLLLTNCPAEDFDSIELECRNDALLIPVQVDNGAYRWVRLDTGCATALEWVTSTVGRKECSKLIGVGVAGQATPTVQTTLHLGSTDFTSVATYLHPREMFAGESGLVGNGVLSRCAAVTIDAAAKRLILERPGFSPLPGNSIPKPAQVGRNTVTLCRR